jgi:hypothetical protein
MTRWAIAAVVGALCGGTPAGAQQALLGIYGAWVLESEDCAKILANDNGRIVFGSHGRGPLPAFIINPTSISNNEYLCAVREFTVRQADVRFTGRCEFGRRTRRQQFAMRELNGRYQIEIGRSLVPVKRCEASALRDLATLRADQERFERENATALDKARGFWASSAELCGRAFLRDGEGRYAVAPMLQPTETALIISPRRFVTRGSTCTSQQVVMNLQTGRDYQANYLCAAEGREFSTTERITVLDPNSIERTPSSRNPMPQRLVRCTPDGWEGAVRD